MTSPFSPHVQKKKQTNKHIKQNARSKIALRLDIYYDEKWQCWKPLYHGWKMGSLLTDIIYAAGPSHKATVVSDMFVLLAHVKNSSHHHTYKHSEHKLIIMLALA